MSSAGCKSDELFEASKASKASKTSKEGTDLGNDEDTPLIKVQKCLNYEPQSIQKIAKKAGLSIQETANALTELEIMGYAEETAKDYYAKCLIHL